MGDDLKNELQVAQRKWVKRVLGVDFEQTEVEGVGKGLGEAELESARRRGVRAELQARVRSVTLVTTERLKAVTPGTHGATELIKQAKALKTGMDQAMTRPDLLSDEVDRDLFEAAADRARLAIEALQAPWQELQTTATAQDIETEQRDEARQKEELQEATSRDHLTELYETAREDAAAKLRRIRAVLTSPDQFDLDLRDATAKVHLAMEHPDYARPAAHDRFVTAGTVAHRAIEAVQTLAEDKLEPEAQRAETIGKAREALTLADQAALEATKVARLFGEQSKSLTEGLVSARQDDTRKTKAEAQETERTAKAEAQRAEMITAAEVIGAGLDDAVKEAVKAADATPGSTLTKAWDTAVSDADKLLLAGSAAAGTLQGIAALLKQTQELTEAVGKLRERAKKWQEARDKLTNPPPSEPEARTIAGVPALLVRVNGDVAALGTLDTELTSAEEALQLIAEAIKAFILLRDQATSLVKDMPTIKGWKQTPQQVVASAIRGAASTRLKDPQAGTKQLNDTLLLAPALANATTAISRCNGLYAELNPKVTTLDPTSLNARLGNAVNSGQLSQLTPLLDEAQRLEQALTAVRDLRKLAAPHLSTITPLRTSKVGEIKSMVTKLETEADKQALAGNGAKALEAMQKLIEQLPALDKFQREGGPVIEKAVKQRSGAQGPLAAVLNRLTNLVNAKVKEDDFNEAMNQVGLLDALLVEVPAYRQAYDKALKLIEQAETLKPPNSPLVPDENVGFRQTLGTALDGSAEQMKAMTSTLTDLAETVRQAIAARQKAMRDAVGGKADDPRTAKLFADEETAAATIALMESLGIDELKKLIGGIGKESDDGLGPKIATALKGLSKDLEGEKIKALGVAIGGLENFGTLCGESGETALPVNLHKQFEGDLTKLTSLVDDGLGGDLTRLRGVVGGGATGATRAKALSDGFSDRNELVTLLGNLGTDAEANEAMTAICNTHFGGDWKKMKTPFFDELAGDPDAPRLMKKAKNFKGQSAPGSMQAPALNGFKSVDMTHVVQRHRPENFQLASTNIKPSNTQFAPGTSPEAIAKIIGSALKELRSHLDGPPNPKVAHFQTSGNFIKYDIEVSDPGVLIRVGYDTGTLEVDQAFPVRLLGGATITLDDFDNLQMDKIVKGLGK